MAGTGIFCAVVVVLSTVGATVIYGLRTQVAEAVQLGQYTLLEKIGEGGMGTVYRARHALLRRPTAIKLLRPERSDGEYLTRFEREVQHTAELSHPNTVAIYDYGRSPDGVFYYVMEYLDGVDLHTLVELDGPQPWRRVVHVLAQVAGALGEAHGRGLVHRDVKPHNIILCRRGGVPDVAKVVDFGLVRRIDSEDGLSQDRVVGTPAYLAPEAITDPTTPLAASDLYALGAVAYYLLTGSPVFEGKTVVQVCVKHLKNEPVPPARRTDNPIPAELAELVMACLRKDPAARPTATALRVALERLNADQRWAEQDANAWWILFEPRLAGAREEAGPSRRTITVDFRSRTDLDVAAPAL
jgi:serine/threonine-protein kinase